MLLETSATRTYKLGRVILGGQTHGESRASGIDKQFLTCARYPGQSLRFSILARIIDRESQAGTLTRPVCCE